MKLDGITNIFSLYESTIDRLLKNGQFLNENFKNEVSEVWEQLKNSRVIEESEKSF